MRRILLPAVVCAALALHVSYAQVRAAASSYDFGKVGLDAHIEHTFTFHHDGLSPLEIKEVQLTPPLIVGKMTNRIEPGGEGSVTVEMQKPLKGGVFGGAVVIHFQNEARKPETFYVEGEVVPPIEFTPHNVIFLSTQRGQRKSSVVEIRNHEPEPFDLLPPQCSARFDCEVKVLEAGRRFSLTVTLKGEGPGEQQTDTIVVPTSRGQHPFLEIKAFSKIRDRVYAFPDRLDFETINVDYLKTHPQMVSFLSQEITVFQTGGDHFQISAQSDIPFLRVSTITAPNLKDRAGVNITVDPTKLKSGSFSGAVTLGTNDPDFPKISIPVTAIVEGNW